MVSGRGSGRLEETRRAPVFKEVKKEGVGNQRLVGLTSVAGKVLKEILPESVVEQTKNQNVMGSSQHGFREGKSRVSLLSVF